MSKQRIQPGYGSTFESVRRLCPRIWDADYCLLRGMADAVRKFALDHVKPGMRIIDIGCGGKPYRSIFPENCEYIGVDASSNPHADVLIEPGQRVPLSDAIADRIISTQVVYLIPEYKFYLQECRRLLRSEGKLFITTHGTWTYHPASGGDYYRFTQDGLRHILGEAGFEVETIFPIVGTLGTGLHLRQLIFNTWLRKMPFGAGMANLLNIFMNARILIEDRFSPWGTRMSSPVILVAIARPIGLPHE